MGKKISTEDNFNFLFYSLIFLLFSIAAVEQFASGVGQKLIVVATIITLTISVLSLRQQKLWFRTGIGVTIFMLLVVAAGLLFDMAEFDVLYLSLLLWFFIFTTVVAGRQVLFTGEITGNKIIGAVCIFILIGLIWTIMYLLLLEFEPGTLNNVSKAEWYNNISSVVYFSFVTLTTLGYGDISPALPVAQFLAYTEALMGQFYIAVMVASLVGVRIASFSSGQRKDK